MSESSDMEPVTQHIATLIAAERSARQHSVAQAFRTVRDDYTRRGALGMGQFPTDLDAAAAAELDVRAHRWLAIAVQSVATARGAWTTKNAEAVEALLRSELARDWEQLQQSERQFAGGRDIVISALNSALELASMRRTAELQLLVQAQDQSVVPLAERLAAPRYVAVAGAWESARSGFPRVGEDPALAARSATGAVEELARIVLGAPKITLGDAIKDFRRQQRLPAPALKGLEELWALRSDTPGVGHGAAAKEMDAAHARYLLDIAEAALQLLLALDAG